MASARFRRCVARMSLAAFLAVPSHSRLNAVGEAEGPAPNWAAPPYWVPPAGAAPVAEGREALGAARRPLASGPIALPFIALPPCRLVDTRGNAPLTGGFLPPATLRNYTLSGVCNVPASAQAISLNATVTNPAGPGFLVLYPKGGAFPPVSTLNFVSGQTIANAALAPLSADGSISLILGGAGADVILDTNGYYAAVPAVSSLNALTGDLTLQGSGAVTVTPGVGAITISAPAGVTSVTGTNGISVSPASGAVTVTSNASALNTPNAIVARDFTGSFSAGSIGVNGNLNLPATSQNGTAGALLLGGLPFLHGWGLANAFVGALAGNFSLDPATAVWNTGVGEESLASLTSGSENTALGFSSGGATTTGFGNVAVGTNALPKNTGGNQNIALGRWAGFNLQIGNNNVYIGNPGLAVEANTIRIGSGSGGITPQHTSFFVAAVRGVTTGVANGISVLIDSNGQLGTTSSSIRFKDDVRDMGDESAKLMQLRPVTFRYKAHGPDGPKQYGLIAEEVDAVMPELVARSKDGEIETVMYHELPAILLNEIQRLEKRVLELERRLAASSRTSER